MDEINQNIDPAVPIVLREEAVPALPSPPGSGLLVLAAIAGWAVPGLGHAVLRQWAKALVYFFAVTLLAVIGLLLRGNVFSYAGADAFDKLGFFADIGTGALYFVGNVIEGGGADVSHAAGDYGTRLFATAGVLNFLCVLEALHTGRRAHLTNPPL